MRNKKLKIEALSYLAVGGVTFFLQVFLSYVAIFYLNIVSPVAIFTSNLFSLLFHYLANRYLTFRSKNNRPSSVFKYVFLAAFNFFIQVAVFNFSLEVVNLGVLASLMLSSGIAAITGFIGMKYWVFSERERK